MLGRHTLIPFVVTGMMVCACTSIRQIPSIVGTDGKVELLLPGGGSDGTGGGSAVTAQTFKPVKKKDKGGEAIIMSAAEDENGEAVIRDSIIASIATARFTNISERMGMVDIAFVIKTDGASDFMKENTQMRLRPRLTVLQDTLDLDRVYLTSKIYRDWQDEGYEKYRSYSESIVHDTTLFIRKALMNRFLDRNHHAVLSDTTGYELYFLDTLSHGVYGITAKEASDHYVRHRAKIMNRRRIDQQEFVRAELIRAPYETAGMRLDSVITAPTNDIIYLYEYSLRTRPKMKKIVLDLSGEVYDTKGNVYMIDPPEPLTYYISSISSLVRESPLKSRTTYAQGIQALQDMDYERAADLLRRYQDFNTALACIGAFRNRTAESILERLQPDADVEYLSAIVALRLGDDAKAECCYREACRRNRFFISRGNLDPEVAAFKKRMHIDDDALFAAYEDNGETI